jgi:two-component system, response regulator
MNALAHILIVEDNQDDYEAARRSFKKYRFVNPLIWCRNAEDALQRLRSQDPHAPSIDLILLDLNMHGIDGRGFLQLIKADPKLSEIPVVVLTTSSDPIDIERCYQLGACSYIQKSVTFEGLAKAVATMKESWLSIAVLRQ